MQRSIIIYIYFVALHHSTNKNGLKFLEDAMRSFFPGQISEEKYETLKQILLKFHTCPFLFKGGLGKR